MNELFETFKGRFLNDLERSLDSVFSGLEQTEVSRIARYVVMNGGHKWRPMVAVAAGKIFDDDAERKVMPAACSIEIVHSASMLMDDLPSMDDAKMRRGKPCAHLVFNDWAIDMSASFLLNLGYTIGLDNPLVSCDKRIASAIALGQTAFELNKGQERDVTQPMEQEEWKNVLECYKQKTGSLYAIAARTGGILCGANEEEIDALARSAMNIGLSVQVFDDVSDVISGVEEMGKHPGKDASKKTCVDFFGIEGSNELGERFLEESISTLEHFDSRADLLRTIYRKMQSFAR